MMKEIIKETLELELQELIKRNKNTYEKTTNSYFKGKYEAYEVCLGMVKDEFKI